MILLPIGRAQSNNIGGGGGARTRGAPREAHIQDLRRGTRGGGPKGRCSAAARTRGGEGAIAQGRKRGNEKYSYLFCLKICVFQIFVVPLQTKLIDQFF